MNLRDAIKHVEKHKICLVFPIKNKSEPMSLWKSFYPRTKMKWEWDDSADSRVAKLWHLREELASSKKVVYAKWYQGRATLIAKKTFVNLLALSRHVELERQFKYASASRMYDLLEDNSPLSTKELKKHTELQGKMFEAEFGRATKELWSSFKIVGVGEKDDGAFPSLLVGATKLIHEDLWKKAASVSLEDAQAQLLKDLGADNLFWKYIAKTMKL